MAVTNTQVYGSFADNGNAFVISVHNPVSAAVNTYLPISDDHTALGTDSVDYKATRGMIINDIATPCVSGSFQVVVDGVPKPLQINVAFHQEDNTARPRPLGIQLGAGQTLRLKVIGVFPA